MSKFLGLDAINVLKDYIDEQIILNRNNTRFITVYAYKYAEDGVVVDKPVDGSINTENAVIVYPIGWNSLQTVLDNIGDLAAIENALSNGSIWMSVGIIEGLNTANWSTPVKISGQNGVSLRFAYSYDVNALPENRTPQPSGVNSENRIEYVWTQYDENLWSEPTIWAMYSEDASDVIWRYCVTDSDSVPAAPISDVDSNWSNSISTSITSDKPYMWMTHKRIPAGQTSNNCSWSEPILFGHYGMDGHNADYNVTLYKLGEGFDVPEYPVLVESNSYDEFITANPTWVSTPSYTGAEQEIWWQCVVKVSGDNTVLEISDIYRFNGVDGEAQPGQFTKYVFYWSDNQALPEDLDDNAWTEQPEYRENEQDGSLWMRLATVKYNTAVGTPELIGEWSNPVKITGPRGPIAYDYRPESLYCEGTANDAPSVTDQWKSMAEVVVSDAKPYIWEKRYLSLYKMKYSDTINADGTYDVVEDSFIKTIGEPEVFRLSGINGKDGINGNKLNNLHYTTTNVNLAISNFDNDNYFVANASDGDEQIQYVLTVNKFGDFVSGYTGKFVNIGNGLVVISAENAIFVGGSNAGNNTASEIQLTSGETVELISHKNGDTNEFIIVSRTGNLLM
jgi:hypothetical protein